LFQDRLEAGKRLAEALGFLKGRTDVVVLAIPRGGVVVAKPVAEALKAPLDLVITRKIGAPGNPELAVGSVTQDGEIIVDKEVASMLGVSEEYLKAEAARQRHEIHSRMKRFRGDRPYPDLAGKTVVIVDDGIATGSTVRAAIRSVRSKRPASVIVAAPVGARESVASLSSEADRMVCLDTPEPFYAIGEFYRDFEQVEDDEVRKYLS